MDGHIEIKPINNNRRTEFRTTAKIYKKDGEKVFVKMAGCPQTLEFLKKIIQREKIAKKYFFNNAKVVEGQLKNNRIYYPFLNLPSLEELILEDIQNGDMSFGVSHIEDYISFLGRLDSKECQPEKFVKEFGIEPTSIPEKLNCLLFAPIDCIPANILVDGQIWYMVDLEWTFDFPMPTAFLIYRGIYSLVINLQRQIQAKVSDHSPVTLFQGYGSNRTYIPCEWVPLLKSLEIPVVTLHYWEFLFQRKMTRNATLGRLRLCSPFKEVTSMDDWSAIDYAVDWVLKFRRYKIVSRIINVMKKKAII